MANSIMGGMGNSGIPGNPATPSGVNPAMLQQFQQFRSTFQGDPKQTVMKMLQQGKINNPQLQNAMQMAQQFKGMLK